MSQFPDSFDPALVRRPAPEARRWLWSASQRRALALLTLAAVLVMTVTLVRRPVVLSDPPPSFPNRFDDLRDRLNPNTASAAELAVLPGIGPAKAQAIIDYRSSHPPPAFASADDLTRVRGIGQVTADKLAPYLYFETETVGDRPADFD